MLGFGDITESVQQTSSDAQAQLDANAFNQAVAEAGGDQYTRGVLTRAYNSGGMGAVNAAKDSLMMQRGTHPDAIAQSAEANALKKQSAERLAAKQAQLRGQLGTDSVRGGERGRFLTNLAAQGEQSMQGIDASLALKLRQLQDAKEQRNKQDMMNAQQQKLDRTNRYKELGSGLSFTDQLKSGAKLGLDLYKAYS